MHSNKVGDFEEFVEINEADAEIFCAFFADKRIIGDNVHVEGLSAFCDARADFTKPDNA